MERTLLHSLELEINVISAEDLRLRHRSIKKNAFVVVRTDSHNYRSTRVDTEGGSYPYWNEKLNLALPNSAKFITVEVQCKTASGRARSVGTASIPVSDFIGDYTPAYYLHFLSYRLREQNGERNGIVNLSIRTLVPPAAGYVHRSMMPQFVGFNVAEKNSGGFAIMGIPMSSGYSM
ncbi:PREDICTED: BON1-associated protein 2 [Nelumbo nucifera]|uniref:BON1-associated protein 2 n=2 Tax=Nelumbo nucifera TaxID=4432 RepID=A0A1U8A2T3_NELNU|nr:PREDICTED: BON1-associated protein 2 [Nelumbo nucifera]DAD18822.1 TPA_asm: hypothetical protein HUJ06_020285 [Nelumbo nucifera]